MMLSLAKSVWRIPFKGLKLHKAINSCVTYDVKCSTPHRTVYGSTLLGITEVRIFQAKNVIPKPTSQYHPGTLAVYVLGR